MSSKSSWEIFWEAKEARKAKRRAIALEEHNKRLLYSVLGGLQFKLNIDKSDVNIEVTSKHKYYYHLSFQGIPFDMYIEALKILIKIDITKYLESESHSEEETKGKFEEIVNSYLKVYLNSKEP